MKRYRVKYDIDCIDEIIENEDMLNDLGESVRVAALELLLGTNKTQKIAEQVIIRMELLPHKETNKIVVKSKPWATYNPNTEGEPF